MTRKTGRVISLSLIAIVLALLPMLVRQRFGRWQGFLLLGLYSAYLLVTVL